MCINIKKKLKKKTWENLGWEYNEQEKEREVQKNNTFKDKINSPSIKI